VNAFASYLETVARDVETALDQLLPEVSASPSRLHAAMRYGVFAGGKRVRPGLLILTGESLGAPRAQLMAAAAALEMIHTFSLIHDDLPALDDDDLRRGRPTLHRQYDEGLAILAGDALLDLGLQVLAEHPPRLPAELRLAAVIAVARAVGSEGMIAGQVEDLEAEGSSPAGESAAELLHRIHRRKTGALIVASMEVGAILAGAERDELEGVRRLGEELGLLFQIQDDILDVSGTSAELGKTAGKDQQVDKLTFPRIYGLAGAKERLAAAQDRASRHLAGLRGERQLFDARLFDARLFDALIEYLGARKN
jgi:geranylgeranyl pyrophosphate synthase